MPSIFRTGRYTHVSSGIAASYFIRSDGVSNCANGDGKVISEVKPGGWPGVRYTKASAGFHASYVHAGM